MPEYVYALHDFHPEHEDEISFHAGQPIEVIEKDDQYGDGWWQVSAILCFPHCSGSHVGMLHRSPFHSAQRFIVDL